MRRAVLLLALCACDRVFQLDHIDADAALADVAPLDGPGPADVNPADASTSYRLAVLEDAPVGYFRLGETSGVIAVNDIPGGPQGKYIGTVMYGGTGAISGDSDSAVSFAYADPGRVDAGDAYDFPAHAAFSLEAWIDPAPDDGHFHDVVAKWHAPTLNLGYEMFYQDGTLSFALEPTNNNEVAVATGIVAGRYTHVVGTYDGAMLQLYVNGSAAGPPVSTSVVLINDTNAFQIGEGDSQAPFGGAIDEVAVYDRALPPERVKAHYLAAQ